ncbi:GTP--adenosylcobinamide-phosphate guanylyltransferase [Methanolobus sp. WCC1]|uniref:GTP:adenosylcobinamide-phosphate guanylyltransferase n=1 Tax=Methanolobus tindarius DSM 2278 TaxID=1090322 RepID=W9DNS3_METTI|nr:GTP--adenosylcobinamide-phosphate guanylyltransferase [Methanolobus tindarius]ETA66630.1 GTP:adenosylcobinamide-phosphate guanylyltransferase [Methanolobus tindarius DSM 2278]
MDAIIMAGGFGSRLGMGEKPCVELLGKPLISYVIDALQKTENIGDIYVAVSPATPKTASYVEEEYDGKVQVIPTGGGNYVGDMVYAVKAACISDPLMVLMSDLPLLTPELLEKVIAEYKVCGKPAMSIFSPISVCKSLGIRPDTVFNWGGEGKLIVPSGVNILDGKDVDHEQDYVSLVMDDVEFALNINTADDLKRCKEMILERDANSIKN